MAHKPTKSSNSTDGTCRNEGIVKDQGKNADAGIRQGTCKPGKPEIASAPSASSSSGYCRPPTHTRFTRGTSGNPAGRPKGSGKAKPAQSPPPESLDELRRRMMAIPVRVREGDGTRELPMIEALIRQLDKLAFAGGVQATRLALARHEETLRHLEAERLADAQWVAEYRDQYPAKAAAYEKAGQPVPDWIARPEDIHFSKERGLRIIGPYTPETLENILLLKRWRDAMQIRMIHDEIVFFDKPAARTTFTMAEFIVHWLDHLMPTRWKLDGKEARDREAVLLWVSRPRLRLKLQEAFEPLGFKPPLTSPMPPVPDKLLRALGINPTQMKARFAAMEARPARRNAKEKGT